MSDDERPCGLYRTTVPTLDGIQADRLVYYHNHGDPGPGVYYPERWVNNRAVFSEQGHTIPSLDYAMSLDPLPKEGFYKVEARFHCCEKKCREFRFGELVQLGVGVEGELVVGVRRAACATGKGQRLSRRAVLDGVAAAVQQGERTGYRECAT